MRCRRDDAKHGNAYYHRRLAPDLVRLAPAIDTTAEPTGAGDDAAIQLARCGPTDEATAQLAEAVSILVAEG